MINLIKISKNERNLLQDAGLIKERKVNKNGLITQDANLVVCNKEHVGKNSKTYYVVESFDILAFLGKYDMINVQKITDDQLASLMDKGYVNNSNIQTWGNFVKGAIVFQDYKGQYYVKKISKMLLDVGIWNNSKTRKEKIVGNFEDSDSDNITMEDLFLN